MRRVWCVLLLLIGALLYAVQLTEANATLSVDEAATRLRVHSDRAEVSLSVLNSDNRSIKAQVTLELINELDRSEAKVEREADLKPGSNTITTELPMTPPKSTLWLRLRYQITTIPASDARTEKG